MSPCLHVPLTVEDRGHAGTGVYRQRLARVCTNGTFRSPFYHRIIPYYQNVRSDREPLTSLLRRRARYRDYGVGAGHTSEAGR